MITLPSFWVWTLIALAAATIGIADGAHRRPWRLVCATGRLLRRRARRPWRSFCARRAGRRLRRLTASAPLAHKPWEVIDYSVKREQALEQLGRRYLLHTPINHNRNTKTVLQ